MGGVKDAMPLYTPLLDVPQKEQKLPHSISVDAPLPPSLHPSLMMPVNSNHTNRILGTSLNVNAKHYHNRWLLCLCLVIFHSCSILPLFTIVPSTKASSPSTLNATWNARISPSYFINAYIISNANAKSYGHILQTLTEFSDLGSLNYSWYQLTASILAYHLTSEMPPNMASMTFFSNLNLSYNLLGGKLV